MPNSTATSHFDDLITGLRKGDSQAAEAFVRRYGEALERVAQSRLPAAVRRRVGADDVVQSACRTFLRRVREGQFELTAGGIWSLLCAITLTKVREQSRFHLRQKRGLAQETPGDSSSAGDSRLDHLAPADPGPTPAEAAEVADQFQFVLALLDDEERKIVDLKLEGLTNEQVAERLESSERTVRRVLKGLRVRLTRELDS